jgi:hypothetical protein
MTTLLIASPALFLDVDGVFGYFLMELKLGALRCRDKRTT